MSARTAALIVGGLDAAGWLLVCAVTLFSQSDPASKGLDNFAGLAVTVVFLLTGVPALALAWRNRAPRKRMIPKSGNRFSEKIMRK